jgi:Xaa-Pro aminopeptidase
MVTDPRFQPRAGRTDDPHNALTLAARDRRWSAARAAMAARGIDCLFVVGVASNNNGNVRWLDNGDGAERYLVFPAKGPPTVLGYAPNWSRWYLENSWEGCDYRPTGASPSVAGANTIEDLGYASGTIGVVGLLGGGVGPEGTIPYMTYRNLQAQLPKAKFVDASDLLMQLRIVKSAEELAMIEKAAELSNVQLDALMRHARPGLRETELAAEIVYASLRAGAEMTYDHPFLFCAGRTGYPVNRRPTDRVLRRGEMILTGHYTRFGGYHSHPHAALSLGPIPDEYREMRDAVCEDTERALELLKPGVPWEEVDRKISEGCLRRGFYHEISQAHCVGLDGVEPPYTTLTRGEAPRSRDVRPRGSIRDNAEYNDLAGNRPPIMKDLLVQEGMAVALECKVAKDDSIFLEFGPQIVIEKNGPRVLTPAAMDVIVL